MFSPCPHAALWWLTPDSCKRSLRRDCKFNKHSTLSRQQCVRRNCTGVIKFRQGRPKAILVDPQSAGFQCHQHDQGSCQSQYGAASNPGRQILAMPLRHIPRFCRTSLYAPVGQSCLCPCVVLNTHNGCLYGS